MKSFLRIWLLLCFCASVSADNYRLVGAARLTGFDVLARKLTGLAQQAAPEAKALPVVMVAAMSFNPNFAAFDLTDPIVVGYYLPTPTPGQPPRQEPPLWCLAVSVSGGGVPDSLRLMGRDAFVKTVGGKALISWSQPLLDSLSAPPPVKETDHDLYLWLNAGEYCRHLPADLQESKDFLFQEVMAPFGAADNPAAAADLRLRLEYVEKILRQSGETEVTVDLLPHEIQVEVHIVPEKASFLGGFIAAQQHKPPLPKRTTAAVSLAAGFTPYAPAVEGVNAFCAALSGWDKAKEYRAEAEFFRQLFAGCGGQGTMTVNPGPDGEQVVAWVASRQAPDLKPFPQDAATGLYRVSLDGARRSIFVRPGPAEVRLAAGKVDAATAVKWLSPASTVSAEITMPSDPSLLLAGTWRTRSGEDALDITGRAPAGSLDFHGDLRVPLLKVIFPRLVRRIGDAASGSMGRK